MPVLVVMWAAFLPSPLRSADYCPALFVTISCGCGRIVGLRFAAHVRQCRTEANIGRRSLVAIAALSFRHLKAHATCVRRFGEREVVVWRSSGKCSEIRRMDTR
jgi:hypothetical protein